MKLSDLQCKDKSNDSGTSEIRTCTEISMLRKTGNFVVVFSKEIRQLITVSEIYKHYI